MLIYVLRWRSSWISDRHKKPKLCSRGPFNDHSWAVWFQLSKWFKRRSVLKHFSHRVQCYTMFCCSHHFEFHIRTKNLKFVEDHPRNIPAKFGSNWFLITFKKISILGNLFKNGLKRFITTLNLQSIRRELI